MPGLAAPAGLLRAPAAPAASSASSASAPSRWRGRSARRPRGCSSRPPTCRWPTSPSPRASPASGSSTTRSARSSPTTPTELRRRPAPASGGAPGWLTLRLTARAPVRRRRGAALPRRARRPGPRGVGRDHLLPRARPAARARRRLASPPPRTARPRCVARLQLTELRDLGVAVSRCRRMLDLDADPAAVDAVLGADPALADAGRRRTRAPRPRLARRPRAGGPRGPRPAGVGRRRPHAHRAAAAGRRRPAGRTGRHAHPRLPPPRGTGRGRPGRASA